MGMTVAQKHIIRRYSLGNLKNRSKLKLETVELNNFSLKKISTKVKVVIT